MSSETRYLYALEDCEQLLRAHQASGDHAVSIDTDLLEAVVELSQQVRDWGG